MLLDTLLCILLHLSVIFSPGQYYQSEIDQYEQENQAAINAIHNDPQLEAQIVAERTPDLEFIDIVDDDAL